MTDLTKQMISTKYRDFQYRLLMNALPMNVNLKPKICTGLGVKPQDMTALSIDYVITLTGGAPSGGR